jgi:hypothetical protein
MQDCNMTAEPAFKVHHTVAAAVSACPRAERRMEFR